MDIPAPSKLSEDKPADEEAINVSVKTKSEELPKEKEIDSDDYAAQAASLIGSKQYNLPIREKRTKPFLVLSLGIKRKKKPKTQHKTVKKSKEPKDNKKQMTQIVVLVVIVLGLVVAMDMGFLNLGFELPFSLFGN